MRIIKLAISPIQEWGAKYLNALAEFHKKGRMEVELEKVEVNILMLTYDQLNNSITNTISSYMKFHVRLEALV